MSNKITPLISVIVPVYRVEQYLPKCIDSILAQTFTDFELLLVDDGSPDRSGEICDEYAAIDRRIRVLHKPNGGVSSARNMGLDNAHGEWIVFVDSDDWVKDSYFKHLIDTSQKYSPDIIQIQYTKDINSFYRDNSHNILLFTTLDSYISKTNRAYTCISYAYKKDSIKGLRFTLGVRLGEDQEFSVKALLCSNKIAYTSDIYYYYNYRESSAMNSETKYSDLDGIRMIREINLFSKKLSIKENKKFLKSVYLTRTVSYIRFLSKYPLSNIMFARANTDFQTLKSIKRKSLPLLLKISIFDVRIAVLMYKIKNLLHE